MAVIQYSVRDFIPKKTNEATTGLFDSDGFAPRYDCSLEHSKDKKFIEAAAYVFNHEQITQLDESLQPLFLSLYWQLSAAYRLQLLRQNAPNLSADYVRCLASMHRTRPDSGVEILKNIGLRAKLAGDNILALFNNDNVRAALTNEEKVEIAVYCLENFPNRESVKNEHFIELANYDNPNNKVLADTLAIAQFVNEKTPNIFILLNLNLDAMEECITQISRNSPIRNLFNCLSVFQSALRGQALPNVSRQLVLTYRCASLLHKMLDLHVPSHHRTSIMTSIRRQAVVEFEKLIDTLITEPAELESFVTKSIRDDKLFTKISRNEIFTIKEQTAIYLFSEVQKHYTAPNRPQFLTALQESALEAFKTSPQALQLNECEQREKWPIYQWRSRTIFFNWNGVDVLNELRKLQRLNRAKP